MRKRAISWLLCLVMLLSLLPAAVFAEVTSCTVTVSNIDGKPTVTVTLNDVAAVDTSVSITVLNPAGKAEFTDLGGAYAGSNDLADSIANSYITEDNVLFNGSVNVSAGKNFVTQAITKTMAEADGYVAWAMLDLTGSGTSTSSPFDVNADGLVKTAQSTLKFDLQGGTATGNDDVSVDAGSTVTLANKYKGTKPVKTGYAFLGWAESAGQTESGNVVATVTAAAKDGTKTVYAVWKEKGTPTVPTVNAVTYKNGLKMSGITLPKTDSNKVTWTWDNGQTPTVGTKNYKASAVETDDYKAATAQDVSVTVNKGTVAVDNLSGQTVKTGTALSDIDITTLGITVKDANATSHTVAANLAWTNSTAVITEANKTATFTVTLTDEAGNYETVGTKTYTFTVSAKNHQTIQADNVKATYGDTGKAISATRTPSDGGTLSYALKAGSATDVVDVAADGKLTIKKVGTATVTVTAAETPNYSAATKDVTVTVSPKKVTVVAPTLTKDGTFPATAEVTGKVDSDTVSVTLAWDPADATVGEKNYTWTATLTGADAANYELTANTGRVNLAPAPSGGGGGGGAASVKVTFEVGENGTLIGKNEVSVTEGGKLIARQVPSVSANSGWKFLGWSADGKTAVDPTTVKIDKAMTFTALYEREAGNTGFRNDYTKPYMFGYPSGRFEFRKGITRAEVATIVARTILPEFDEGFNEMPSYSDLQGGHWANKYIAYLEDLEVLTGYPDGTFKPNQVITRAEFVAIIGRVEGLTEGSNPYKDVEDLYWATPYIESASACGYVNGYSDGTFRPRQYITRAEGAKIMNAVLGWTGSAPADAMRFPDVYQGYWAYDEIRRASTGILVEE